MRKRRTLRNVARPCSMPATIVEKWSSRARGRRLPGDVGAGLTHGDADVGLVQRRAVVDPIAGHRHDVTTAGPGDPQLVLWGNPSDDDPVAVEHGTEDLLVIGQVMAQQDRIVGVT